ncbi:ArdC-like ssDNA-binding domain-containing protein [Enterococcus sp. DIV0187]|uniref:ArdC-like ssDNA-binding domain-containing protein n=1 Tax=Enterococcus sp. DIV0187 TaxID=2774644 RepID=UPI003F6830B6
MSITKEKVKSRYESLSPHVKALLESDEIKQWSNDPTIYFVAGLKKVALELTPEGEFIESKKYPATTDEAKRKVAELLSEEAVINKKIPFEEEERSIQDIIKQKDYKALSSHLKNGISSYLETDVFKNYLNFVSKFHKYSHRNVRLLLAQNPETTRVAGYKKWQEVGRTVNKGEKALYVYAPGSKIVKDKNGKPVKDENGQVVKERFFFLTPVFDVSKTSGEPIPKPIHDLEGNFETPEQFVKVYKAVESISPVPIKIEPIEGSARGYYHKIDQEIVVKAGLGEIMTLKTLIHEITHAKLHADSTCAFGDEKYSQQEFEAESVAYIVSNHLGIDTSDYSFGYLASWTKQGQSVDSFTESLDRITKEAQQVIESLEKSLSLSFAMAEPANKFEERVAKAQGRDIQPLKSETKTEKKEVEPTIPKEERPRLNP